MKAAAISSIAWAVALRANLAAAHGYVSEAIIDGSNYTGYLPDSGMLDTMHLSSVKILKLTSPFRSISLVNPIPLR